MSSDDSAGRAKWPAVALAALAALVLVVWWPGCRQYPRLTDGRGIALNKVLYSACSAKDPARLAAAEAKIEAAAADGTLTADQAEAFRGILATAKAGDWDTAAKAAYRFAEDQVR